MEFLKTILRAGIKFICFLIYKCGIVKFYIRRRPLINEAIILLYHDVTAKLFEQHVKYLTENYDVLSLDALVNLISNAQTIPENSIVITFDDGYKSVYSDVFPVLEEYDIPATIYLTSDIVGSMEEFWYTKITNLKKLVNKQYDKDINIPTEKYLKTIPNDEKDEIIDSLTKKYDYSPSERCALSWNEAKQMQKSSLVTYGAHTKTHPCLIHVSCAEAREEIIGSKVKIESELRTEVKHFSYPNGDFNESHIEMLREAKFSSAVTSIPGVNTNRTNPYKLKRIDVEGVPVYILAAKISGLWHKLGGNRSVLRELKNRGISFESWR
jgi:peptidoglycan/xylan/chitin deacetylase (PgdA/CDA1 family)